MKLGIFRNSCAMRWYSKSERDKPGPLAFLQFVSHTTFLSSAEYSRKKFTLLSAGAAAATAPEELFCSLNKDGITAAFQEMYPSDGDGIVYVRTRVLLQRQVYQILFLGDAKTFNYILLWHTSFTNAWDAHLLSLQKKEVIVVTGF